MKANGKKEDVEGMIGLDRRNGDARKLREIEERNGGN